MLEPYEGKLSHTVLRGERGSNTPDLPDQTVENKQKFIGQVMTSKSPVRSCEDIDETAMTYGEIKALATGNPLIREKMTLDMEVGRLKLAKAAYSGELYRLEDNIARNYPMRIAALTEKIKGYEKDVALYQEKLAQSRDSFLMAVRDRAFSEKKKAGEALIKLCGEAAALKSPVKVGNYLGFPLTVSFDSFGRQFFVTLEGAASHSVMLGEDPVGNITRINNALEGMAEKLAGFRVELAEAEKNLEEAKEAVKRPLPKEQELAGKLARLSELDMLLDIGGTGMEQEKETENVQEQDTKKLQEGEESSTRSDPMSDFGDGSNAEVRQGRRKEWEYPKSISVQKESVRISPYSGDHGGLIAAEKGSAYLESKKEEERSSVRMKLALYQQKLRQEVSLENRRQEKIRRPSL